MLVVVTGAAVALAANYVSPRRLVLSHDYLSLSADTPSPVVNGSTNGSPQDPVRLALEQAGLHLADSNRVAQLFHDPRRPQNLVVFLDARDPEHYEAGHIPGAYEFDYFHLEKYVATVLPLCQNAEAIVIYCNGGDCEDSIHAAKLLTEEGKIPKDKMWVYGGGITEWTANGQPTETGPGNNDK